MAAPKDTPHRDQDAATNRCTGRQQQGPQRRSATSRRGSLDDESYDKDHAGFGPWVEVTSSRVAAVRYDSSNQAVQVQWADGRAPYIYTGVRPEQHRAFLKAGSKGRAIGMLGTNYRPASPQELDAPSSA
jgi:KTSC domain